MCKHLYQRKIKNGKEKKIEPEIYSELCQDIFCVTLSYSGAQPEIFQGRGSLMGLGHFHKHFVIKTPAEKRLRREKFRSFFS